MLPTPIVVSGTENVTWTGETGCIPQECRIIQLSYDGSLNHSTRCSYVVFKNCRGVTVQGLGFLSSAVTARYFRPCNNMKLVGVEDAFSYSVILEGKYGLKMLYPSGRYKVLDSILASNSHVLALDYCPYNNTNCSVSLNLTNVTFTNSHGLHTAVGRYATTQYSSISLLVNNCSFTGYGHKQLVVDVRSYPSDSLATIVRNSVFRQSLHSVHLSMVLLVQDWSLVGAPRRRPYILLDGVRNINIYHGISIHLFYQFHDNSCDVQYPEIIITNSSFSDSKKSNLDTHVHGVHAILHQNNSAANFEQCRALHSHFALHPSTVLRFKGSKFHSNRMSAVVYLEGFSWHRAAFDGGNEISNNHGIGLVLSDTQLEIHGYNDIHENDGGGLFMTSDSLLLMANGSVLNVSHNSAEFGGGIHISYKGRSIASYEDFLHCYVYKTTCPGWCFFQFVDQNGHLLRQDDLDAYQANLNLENNHVTEDMYGNEIFNGHLHNCSLMTKDGVIGTSTDTLLKVLPSQVLEDDNGALDSLPQYICLCNTSKSQDSKL